MGSWTYVDERITASKIVMTTRGGVAGDGTGRSPRTRGARCRWALGCDWHTANDAVVAYRGALLAADVDRVGAVEALGLDESAFLRTSGFRTTVRCTSITDVTAGRPACLIEIIEGEVRMTLRATRHRARTPRGPRPRS